MPKYPSQNAKFYTVPLKVSTVFTKASIKASHKAMSYKR